MHLKKHSCGRAGLTQRFGNLDHRPFDNIRRAALNGGVYCLPFGKIAPRLIASADDLEALANDDNAPIRALVGWRREIFGELALRLKRGEIALAVKNEEILLVEHSDTTS